MIKAIINKTIEIICYLIFAALAIGYFVLVSDYLTARGF